ncbi:sulfatase family protein [Vallitalea okinawensis]|uniref:sulfatase family protein n=1 Tax=Vallitalea okinawensis TaxID=2078660 RepID=UPI000CFBBD76|nr:sulfatase [Vallitalea okinawensis]
MNKKNVIWIFGDQHRGQALGINGDPNIYTPNIDNLARLGVNFKNAVSGFPLCCPFRGSLLTSKYPHKCVPGHEYPLDTNHKTIAHAFNDQGYHTAYFGKWHLDGFEEFNMRLKDCNDKIHDGRAAMHIVPPERRGGFKRWIGYDNNNSPWDTWVHGGDGDETRSFKLDGYETDVLSDMLIDYLKEKQEDGESFFAVLSVQPPHNPYVAPAKFQKNYTPGRIKLRGNVPNIKNVQEKAREDLAGYYAQIENLDYNLGRIREALNEFGLTDDTHIVFFSDHGDMHGSHGQYLKMSPMQESISIPFIIGGELARYNGRLNGDCHVPINHVDIAPTTLGLCGLDVPDWMEGTDYAHYRIKGRRIDEEPDSAYLQSVIPTGHHNSVDRPWRGIVTKDGWKYICFKRTPWLMFNLNEDPYEQVNLAHNSKFIEKRIELNDRLQQWITDTEDSFDLPELTKEV